jgi:PAS domain S-box-containing protein
VSVEPEQQGAFPDQPSGRSQLPATPTAKARWRRTANVPSGLIAFLYAVIGALWILFSDRAVFYLVHDPQTQVIFNTAKGWVYVAVTALLLHLFIRRSTAGLRRLDEEIKATFESLFDGVLVLDANGAVVEANQAAVQLAGVARKEELLQSGGAFAQRFQLSRPDGTQVSLRDLLKIQVAPGKSGGRQVSLRRADGGLRWIDVASAPLAGGDVNATRLSLVVMRDVSEQKRFEEMRDDFLAVAAHEFKTPLAVIKAYSQLLEKRKAGPAPILQVINRQVDRLSRMVQQLLQVSRLRLGDAGLRREPFDLEEMVQGVVGRMRRMVDRHRLIVELGPAVPVEADRERLEQVLVNLIDNAVRFSPEGGDIEAAVAQDGAEAVVSVRDHGVGIPSERQAHVFEPFYRAHAGTSRDYGGLAVGLDISREIVARHGGRIWFESAPGRGSTFFFALPLSQGAGRVH